MIQKATTMSNWWLATISQQWAHSCITSHAVFFCETSDHPGDSGTPHPRFGILWLLAFPKTEITFEREEISDHWWDSGKYYRAADGNWEKCVRSQGADFEGEWASMFLISSLINVSFFIVHDWIPSGQTSYMNQITMMHILNRLKYFKSIIPQRPEIKK